MRIEVSSGFTRGFGQEQVDAEHQADLGPLMSTEYRPGVSDLVRGSTKQKLRSLTVLT